MAHSLPPAGAATVRDLDNFQNNQHIFSRLQLLPSFNGSPITRFDTWLESFESIVDGSRWSEDKTIQMLRAKLTDRAFSVIQSILKTNPNNYVAIKEALLDHFHGDENADLYLKKFDKAKRKPGEKIVDYALRLQEIFKRAYPVGHTERSFVVILKQKFIDGLDSKLQSKVKYKEFPTFNELVAATRVYALRLESIETDREKQEFIRAIDGSSDTNSAELKEIKQMIIDQREVVNNAVANIRHGSRPNEEVRTEKEEIKDVLQELMQTMKNLQLERKDVTPPPNTQYKKQRLFNKLPPRGQVVCSQLDFDLYDVGEKKLHTLGRVTLPVRYGESLLRQEFIITNGVSEDCILGWDAIQKHGFRLDGEAKSIYLARDEQGPLAISKVPDMAITTVKKTTLSRQTSMVIAAQVTGSFPYVPPFSAFMFTPVEDLPAGIYIEEFIGNVSGDGTYQIIVENHSLNQVNIPRNTTLGVIEIINQVIRKVALDTSDVKPLEPREPIVISEVDPEFQAPLSQLLNDFRDLFASKDSELGNTNLIKHTINTEGRGPIRQRPYRVTNNQRKILEDKVQEMLEAKVIRYSQSPWASPVVLVEKKDGEVRFCVDYRKLNSITKKDSFPMPRIDETLDKLYGKKFFTTLDLASGYWQIQVHDPDIEKTAFVVENNLYEFKRMAFGLCNAPATFQRLMNYVLRDVLGSKATPQCPPIRRAKTLGNKGTTYIGEKFKKKQSS
ncbi:hypothetical protein GHT06_020180 [Daphnia sinensis]|uniref:Reverse transcriptase domain-containing protein n=1 Tax=Daphnia sinensis TaxID=1820382 RepID=A0AAD5KM90_9CRUS|nr:hypothetical protein GHT06_020180 [Daphnia sinensis]